MELNRWVKAAREHADMTIEQLGAALGRSKAAAGFWETGATKPSYAQVKRISEVTGWPMPDDVKPKGAATEMEIMRERRWPFGRVDYDKLVALSGVDARNMENAMLAAAGDLDLDIRVGRSANSRQA